SPSVAASRTVQPSSSRFRRHRRRIDASSSTTSTPREDSSPTPAGSLRVPGRTLGSAPLVYLLKMRFNRRAQKDELGGADARRRLTLPTPSPQFRRRAWREF